MKRTKPPCLRCGRNANYDYDSEQGMHWCQHCGLYQPMKISVARLNWELKRHELPLRVSLRKAAPSPPSK